jgi:hypothetical protein
MPVKASMTITFPLCSTIAQTGTQAFHCWDFYITDDYTHTLTHGRTPLCEWSARRRGNYLYNTQQTQKTNIHALSGTQTWDHGKQAASVLRLRPHDRQDQQFCSYAWLMKTLYNATTANNIESVIIYSILIYLSSCQNHVETHWLSQPTVVHW